MMTESRIGWRRAIRGGLGALLLLACGAADAQNEVAALLDRPRSPGNLALLLPHAMDRRVPARLVEALSDGDPRVRATAARLLLVLDASGIAPALRKALAAESDERAAVEIARALLRSGPAEDTVVLDVALRLAPDDLAMTIAEARGPAAVVHLDRIRLLPLSYAARRAIASTLVRGKADEANRLAQIALKASDVELWRATLDAAHAQNVQIDLNHVAAALESASSDIRQLAWWHAALLAAGRQPVPPSATPDSARRTEEGSSHTPELTFGRELAARALGAAALEDQALLDRLQQGVARFGPVPFAQKALSGPLRTLLTKAERKALDRDKSFREPSPAHSVDAAAETVTPTVVVRTVGELPDGYVDDVLRQTGCDATSVDRIAGVGITYGSDGRRQRLDWMGADIPDKCKPAARYILLAALLPRGFDADSPIREILLVPINPSALQCLAASESPAEGKRPPTPASVGRDDIVPPKKTRHVAPSYPQQAQAARRQGKVIIEATITREGCTRELRVLRGAGLDLDVSAIQAISQWRFTPTLLRGTPVPVIMTVTVGFELH